MATTNKQTTLLDYSAWWWTSDTFFTTLVENSPVGHLYQYFKTYKRCPYCHTPAVLVLDAHLPGPKHDPDESRYVKIWGCLDCGWWHDEFAKVDPGFIGWERFKRRVPYLRRFTIDSESLPIETLSSELLTHPKIIHQLNPKRLESFVAAVLSDFFDVEVSVIGRTGDGGIDLVYVHTDKAFAVQVKRRESPEAKEGASLVREFLGACVLSGHRNAKIVTTAGDYTEGAKVTAQKAIQCLAVDSYDLIARDRFIELFRYTSLAYKYPWTEIAKYWKDTWYNTKAKFWTQDSYLK
jgi:hypothetical protein